MSGARAINTGTHLGAGFYFPDYKYVMAESYLPDFELFTYFAAINRDEHTHLFFLESLTDDENARYSILGFHCLLQLETRAGLVSASHHTNTHYLAMNIFEAERSLMKAQSLDEILPNSYFCGGMVGYWGYDLALQVEAIKRTIRSAPPLPVAAFFCPESW
jgi:anthranilate synthase component 1